MQFTSLGLSDAILSALNEKGYTQPSPIQAQAIPVILEGHDLMAAAQTGTGKTAAFLVPILQKLANATQPVRHNSTKVLILTPTRELAAQIYDSALFYGKNLASRYAVVFGGVKINPQMMRLRPGVDVLIATPGRLLDLFNQNAIKFDQVETFVLDEADRMLDMGFIHDIKKIIRLLPKKRQTLMFSATFSAEIRELTKGLLHNPAEIDVSPRNSTAETIKQVVYTVAKSQKSSLLSRIIKDQNWQQVLVFSRTKHGANRIVAKLNNDGITALAIHGNKSQGARTKALANFKQGLITVLVATDIAARGIDIAELPHVVNYDLPNVAEDYVHRIGRTGRAGRNGEACSLVSHEEKALLRDIQKLIKMEIPVIPNAGYTDLEHHAIPENEPRPMIQRQGTRRPDAARKPRTSNARNGRSTSRSGPRSPGERRDNETTTERGSRTAKPQAKRSGAPSSQGQARRSFSPRNEGQAENGAGARRKPRKFMNRAKD